MSAAFLSAFTGRPRAIPTGDAGRAPRAGAPGPYEDRTGVVAVLR